MCHKTWWPTLRLILILYGNKLTTTWNLGIVLPLFEHKKWKNKKRTLSSFIRYIEFIIHNLSQHGTSTTTHTSSFRSKLVRLSLVFPVIERTHSRYCSWVAEELCQNASNIIQWKCALRMYLHLDTDTKKSTSRRNMLKHNNFDTVCVQMLKSTHIYWKLNFACY